MTNKSYTQDGEELKAGDVVCFADPQDAEEENALFVVRETRDARILVSDQQELLAPHKPGYIVATRVLLSSWVLKVA